jgi:orotate phosphoribosyltransferase
MTQFKTWYMDQAVFDLAEVIETAQKRLADVEFDTMVGTGFSGGIVIPSLALAMGKKFVLIRKETDDSHHGKGRLLGELGERWIFVDDLVSSGMTRKRVIKKIGDVQEKAKYQETFAVMVGQYLYQDYADDNYIERGRFQPYDSCWAEVGW